MESNLEKRKYIRISLQGKITKDLGLESNIGSILINGQFFDVRVDNISISGALIILQAEKDLFTENDTAVLTIKDMHSTEISLPASVVYAKNVNEEHLIGLGIEFHEKMIPEKYTNLLEDFWNKSMM